MSRTADQDLALASVNAAATGTNRRHLVIIYLGGGNDAHNTVIPTASGPYADYVAGRPTLALANDTTSGGANQLRPLSGTQLALHPNLNDLADLYNAGKVALIANVGPLVQPMTKAQWNNGRPLSGFRTPFQLFSHSDQDLVWQTGYPGVSGFNSGWAGRAADLLNPAYNGSATVSMNLNISRAALAVSGNDIAAYSVPTGGPADIDGRTNITTAAHLAGTHTNYFEKALDVVFQRATSSYAVASAALSPITASTTFPTSSLGNQLKMVSRLIRAAGATPGLAHRRQIYWTTLGGFDQHAALLANHGSLMTTLDTAVKAFQDEMALQGLEGSVTTLIYSEFGRALLANGDGSDHGWGGHAFVIGGSVNSGVYGTFPEYKIGGIEDAGQGRLIPTTSTTQLHATLLKWMGIPDVTQTINGRPINAMDITLPTLSNFSTRSLGFMAP